MGKVLELRGERATIILWEIAEGESELSRLVTRDDILSAERFINPNRRVEHLSARAALRAELPKSTKITYTTIGNPVTDCGEKISVSHTKQMVSVMISNGRCSIDIESANRELGRVSSRFISPNERALSHDPTLPFEVLIWCAKETLYKFSRLDGLDFIEDLKVTSISPCEKRVDIVEYIDGAALHDVQKNMGQALVGEINGSFGGEQLAMQYLLWRGYVLVFTVAF